MIPAIKREKGEKGDVSSTDPSPSKSRKKKL
jgi:hypothetical protein